MVLKRTETDRNRTETGPKRARNGPKPDRNRSKRTINNHNCKVDTSLRKLDSHTQNFEIRVSHSNIPDCACRNTWNIKNISDKCKIVHNLLATFIKTLQWQFAGQMYDSTNEKASFVPQTGSQIVFNAILLDPRRVVLWMQCCLSVRQSVSDAKFSGLVH